MDLDIKFKNLEEENEKLKAALKEVGENLIFLVYKILINFLNEIYSHSDERSY